MSIYDILLLNIGLIVMIGCVCCGFYFGIKGLTGKDLTSKSDKQKINKKTLTKFSRFLGCFYCFESLSMALLLVGIFAKIMSLILVASICFCSGILILIIYMICINCSKSCRKKSKDR